MIIHTWEDIYYTKKMFEETLSLNNEEAINIYFDNKLNYEHSLSVLKAVIKKYYPQYLRKLEYRITFS